MEGPPSDSILPDSPPRQQKKTGKPPTADHEAGPGYRIVVLVGGAAGGQTVEAHIEQSELEVAGAVYHRLPGDRFVAAALLRGAWGRA